MSVLRCAAVEARVLHRKFGLALTVGLAVWAILARLQEPSLSRQLLLFWSAMEAALLLGVGLLPVGWILGRGTKAGDWLGRITSHPARHVLACWLALSFYAVAMASLLAVLSYSLDRIYGRAIAAAPFLLVGEATLFALPISALAPGLAARSPSPYAALTVWAALLTASFVVGLPVPTGSLLNLQQADLSMTALRADAVVASALATAAGLLFSLASTRLTLRA